MYLKKLEMYGFKSFGEKIEIDFDSGITAIVGPNGSGKSNVADAVRWVLGEQSAKSLRGSRMEDVIFSGTEKRKALSYCEVTLTFDNAAQWMPVEYSEVAVTRRVYRSGESEYSINKTSCRLKDITALFRDTGVGREGYSIISQGRIDDILSNKKEERRAVFEEAAGVMKYRVRKEEAQSKLERTRGNMLRIEDKLDELSEQLEPMREQSEKAQVFFELRDRLKDLEINLFLYQYDRCSERIESGQMNLEALEQEERELSRQAAEMEQNDGAQEAQALDAAIAEAQAGILTLTQQLEQSQGRSQVLGEKVESLRRDRERLQRSAEEDREKLRLLEDELQSRQAEAGAKSMERQACAQNQAQSQARLDAAAAELDAAENALEQAKAALMRKMNSLADAKNRRTRLTTMKQSNQSRAAEIDAELAAAMDKKQGLDDELVEARQMLEAARMALDTAGQAQKRAEKAAADFREGMREAEKQAAECAAEIGAAQSRLSILEDMERDYEGYHGSVKSLLKAAKTDAEVERRLDSVVAQVVSVPGKYQRAIEMALGGAMQNIITETEHDAKFLIETLRKKGWGRATFLPIAGMRPRTLNAAERAALSMPGCLGAACDLIGYKEKYRPVIERLLGRAVVADTLDTAIALMRRCGFTFTTVTLDGDIMHPGGSMTGGSVQARTSSILGRERLIEQTRAQVQALSQKRDTLHAQADASRQSLGSLRQAAADAAADVQALRVELAREEEKCQTVQTFFGLSRDAAAKLTLEKEQLAESLSDIETQLGDITNEQSGLESGEQGEREDIKTAAAEVAGLRQALETAREENTRLRIDFTRLDKEFSAADADVKRLTREGEQLRAAMENRAAELMRSRQEESALLGRAGEEDESGSGIAARLKSAGIGLQELERLRREASEQAQENQKKQKALQASIQEVMEKKYKLQITMEKQKMDAETMQARIWEDYRLTYGGAEPLRRKIQVNEAKSQINAIKDEIRELGPVNPNAVEDYRNVKERHDFYTTQKADLEKAASDLETMIEEMLVTMRRLFREQFDRINENFSDVFQRLFGGGHAELALKDRQDVLNSDIDIIAQPPGKKLQLISLLSGGEKALTAISILFAMLRLKPTPFCVLDEIEASLDEANVTAFAEYLNEYAKKTQFVVITHRKGTMEHCDTLYGMAMEEKGISRLVSVKYDKMAEKMAAGG